jgi:4,5-dihydroxyphthalate decarboxylase
MQLKMGLGNYDRTAPLLDGRIGVAGADSVVLSPPLEELFVRAFDKLEFDVAELSFSNYVYLSSVGKCPYIALPVFPSRTFRHSAIYVRADRGISSPRDLIGRLVGVREYSMTAALMARGLLEDDFGVASSALRWRCGRAEAGEAAPVVRMQPRDVEVESIAETDNLSDMLEAGSIDALVAYKPPSCFVRGAPQVRRLFPDHVSAERDYYARTGVFPIMHLVAVKRELAERQPQLCIAICNAFEQARRLAFAALESHAALAVALPWALANLNEARALMGPDYWPYGVAQNRAAIDAVARYSFAQGLAPRVLRTDELFVQATLGWLPSQALAPALLAH